MVAGFLWALSGWQLPVIPQRFFTMLAGAAAPSALFSLGITLAGQKFNQARAEISVISLFKLILHPALIAALFLLWPGVEADWIKVAILAACLPVAANVFVMADYYRAYSGGTASAIMLSTLFAGATVPVVLYLILRYV